MKFYESALKSEKGGSEVLKFEDSQNLEWCSDNLVDWLRKKKPVTLKI